MGIIKVPEVQDAQEQSPINKKNRSGRGVVVFLCPQRKEIKSFLLTNIAFGRVGMDSLLVRRNTGIFGCRMIVTNRGRKDHEMITQVELMIS